jgi:AcrR family transcriptional regulator
MLTSLALMSKTAMKKDWGQASPSADAITRAALEYIDANGLSALTIRALAESMGSFPANLYRQISGREDLLDSVVTAVIHEADLPDFEPGEDWEGWLIENAVRLRRTWKRHPNAIPLLFRGENQAGLLMSDRISSAFLAANLPSRILISGIYSYATYIIGSLAAAMFTIPPAMKSVANSANVGIDAPSLKEVERVAMDMLNETDMTVERADDELFMRGLRLLLNGLRDTKPSQ